MSKQATIGESVRKTACKSCKQQIVPAQTPATNRQYCPVCGKVFEQREWGLFNE